MTLNMKVTVKDKLELLVQVFKFMSNEYRHFPVRFQINLKKAASSNAIGAQEIMRRCGNVTGYSFEKDVTYHVCNFIVDETRLPPLIPTGRYKVDVKILYLNEAISHIAVFVEIYTPIEYPKD